MVIPISKVCKTCGIEKPSAEFYPSRNRDGLAGKCKPCYYAYNQAKRQEKRRRLGTEHIPPEKQCAKCGVTKPSDQFAVYRSANDGLGRFCRECDNAVSRARRYGIPEDRVRLMAKRPACEVCGFAFENSRQQHFDHRHSDGAVRGVLCFRCNSIVGDGLEDPRRLLAVARYLTRTKTTDYRVQQYSVTEIGETDISHVSDGPSPTPEEQNRCQTKSLNQ